jgi:thymidylate synthase (FAD)
MKQVGVLDTIGYVRLIETWGSDERIIESARMSTSGSFVGWGPFDCPSCGAGTTVPRDGVANKNCRCKGEGKVPGDEKLLHHLWTHKHTTPFEMSGMTIEVQAPIVVFREWHRHRTQSYNEMSGRYTVLPNMFYVPTLERAKLSRQHETKKQGSSDTPFTDEQANWIIDNLMEVYTRARGTYEILIQAGVAKEIARLCLPVAQYSKMRASANLVNWFRFLRLRTAPDAQYEIRCFANATALLLAEAFPRTWSLFEQEKP